MEISTEFIISIMEILLECDSQYGNKYGIYGAPLWK